MTSADSNSSPALRPSGPLRPPRAAAYGLAVCSCCLGLLVSIWLAVKEEDGLRIVLGVGPFLVLAVAAAWPWTSRAAWYVLAIGIVIVSSTVSVIPVS